MDGVTLADRMANMSESATLALNARAKQLAAEGKPIYNLTAGELADDTPEYIQQAVKVTLSHNKYTPVAGLPELRQQIASNARLFYGLDWIEDANVVVTAGAKPALYAAFLALINPGDEVIVPTPAWVSYNQLIEMVGGKVVEVPLTDKFDLDVEAIIAKVTPKTKAILINSPNNPTGTVYSELALSKLAKDLENSNITVISDDIYAKLIYTEHFTLVPTCGFKNIVIINGFSKSQALTGWRIGYLIAHQDVAHASTSLLSHMMGNAAVPSQYAALAAMSLGDNPPQKTLDTLARQRRLVDDSLKDIKSLKYHMPGGAFYYFLDLRKLTDDSARWCEQLLIDTGVALVPGEAFSAPGFARLSFVTDEKTLAKGLQLIKNFILKVA
ncbi:MAG: pyridoxal phosphate-dependent aminotransferase [Candidatus Saccharimonadales bacterium]